MPRASLSGKPSSPSSNIGRKLGMLRQTHSTTEPGSHKIQSQKSAGANMKSDQTHLLINQHSGMNMRTKLARHTANAHHNADGKVLPHLLTLYMSKPFENGSGIVWDIFSAWRFFLDSRFCPFPLFFAAFGTWKLLFPRYLRHFGLRTFFYP